MTASTHDTPQQYNLKAQFFLIGSPDELLKLILDESSRHHWDFELLSAKLNSEENKTTLTYYGPNNSKYAETVEFSYMLFEQKFYIVEQVNSSDLKEK